MLHWKVLYSSSDWFHIYASSNNSAFGGTPNGWAKIFMRGPDEKGPKMPIIVHENDPDGYTADEHGAMKKMIDTLNNSYCYYPLSIIKF